MQQLLLGLTFSLGSPEVTSYLISVFTEGQFCLVGGGVALWSVTLIFLLSPCQSSVLRQFSLWDFKKL